MNLDVEKILTNLAAKHERKFMYQGKEMPVAEVFAFDGALPIFVQKANTLADFLFGAKLEVSMQSDPESLTGEKVVIGDNQHLFLLVMMLYDVLEEMVVSAGDGDVVVQ